MYLPAANFDSALSASASIFLRKIVRAVRLRQNGRYLPAANFDSALSASASIFLRKIVRAVHLRQNEGKFLRRRLKNYSIKKQVQTKPFKLCSHLFFILIRKFPQSGNSPSLCRRQIITLAKQDHHSCEARSSLLRSEIITPPQADFAFYFLGT